MANEKRLIDANAFWESVSTDYWEHFTQCHTTDQIDLVEMIKDNLAEQPTVDAVEVVRCKDCEFCYYNSSNDTYKCRSMNGMYRTVKTDDFCSYGERREGE